MVPVETKTEAESETGTESHVVSNLASARKHFPAKAQA